MPAMLEVSGKRRGRNSASNTSNTKSLASNGNSSNSWEEGSCGSCSSDEEHGGGGMRVGAQYQAVVPDYDAEVAKSCQERENLGMLVWSPNRTVSEAKRFVPDCQDPCPVPCLFAAGPVIGAVRHTVLSGGMVLSPPHPPLKPHISRCPSASTV
ncbi:UNVERIFIED_CONTAM: hypothetical protein FKN15_016498 [Acipenser sinensis]